MDHRGQIPANLFAVPACFVRCELIASDYNTVVSNGGVMNWGKTAQTTWLLEQSAVLMPTNTVLQILYFPSLFPRILLQKYYSDMMIYCSDSSIPNSYIGI